MWRAFFLAVGVYACILGGECLLIDKAVLRENEEKAATFPGVTQSSNREIVAPEWAPWSLVSAGAITILYSFTIPRRASGA